jgi:hypothetical protein
MLFENFYAIFVKRESSIIPQDSRKCTVNRISFSRYSITQAYSLEFLNGYIMYAKLISKGKGYSQNLYEFQSKNLRKFFSHLQLF